MEGIDLSIGDLAGAGWMLKGVQAHLEWRGEHGATLSLAVAKALLPETLGSVSGLQGECDPVSLTPEAIVCHGGVLSADTTFAGHQRWRFDFDYRSASEHLVFAVEGIKLDGGVLAAQLEYEPARWSVSVRGNGLPLAALSRRLASAGVVPGPLAGAGTLAFTARLRGSDAQMHAGELSMRLQTGEISDATGRIAARDLGLQLHAKLERRAGSLRITSSIDAGRGQFYLEPVFLDLDPHPLHVSSTLDWQLATGRLEVRTLDYDHRDTVRLHATCLIRPDQPHAVDGVSVAIEEGHLPALYDTYLQPWLNDSPLADLKTAGALTGDIQWQPGGSRVCD